MADKRSEKFNTALKDAKVPVLVLDNKWYKLLKKVGTTPEMIKLEEKLKELLKRQGKINYDIKAIKKLKKDLREEIVSHMDDGAKNRNKEASDKKLDENKRLIEEANEKIEAYNDEMLDLPIQIDEVNKELMLYTMELCYDRLAENTDEIEVIADWIKQIRVELKKKVIKKQEKELENTDLYTFMHNVFGHDAMDLFDLRYEPTLRVPEKKAKSDEAAGNQNDNTGLNNPQA